MLILLGALLNRKHKRYLLLFQKLFSDLQQQKAKFCYKKQNSFTLSMADAEYVVVGNLCRCNFMDETETLYDYGLK